MSPLSRKYLPVAYGIKLARSANDVDAAYYAVDQRLSTHTTNCRFQIWFETVTLVSQTELCCDLKMQCLLSALPLSALPLIPLPLCERGAYANVRASISRKFSWRVRLNGKWLSCVYGNFCRIKIICASMACVCAAAAADPDGTRLLMHRNVNRRKMKMWSLKREKNTHKHNATRDGGRECEPNRRKYGKPIQF